MNVDSYLRTPNPRSRRDFFRLASLTTVGGSAVFLAACGGDDNKSSDTSSDAGGNDGDVAILNSALDLETTAVAAYTAGATLLKGDALKVGKQFAMQEQEHADGLSQAIKDLGGTPNKPKTKEDIASMLAGLKNQKDVLTFAVDLENSAIAAYLDALPKLSSPELRGTASAIATNEAEHVSVLLGALGKDPVPDAFVTGKKS